MTTLKETLCATMISYAKKGLNGYAYLVNDPGQGIFTVIAVGYIKGERLVDANMIVRLVEDKVIIERDMNNKVLVDALVQAGIPRSQIILAYAGELVPELV